MAAAAPEIGATPRARPRKRARHALRAVHRLLGLFVAGYVLMASLTGAVLLFRAEILALTHPTPGAVPGDVVTQAQRLASTLKVGSYTAIRFPDDTLPFFIVHRPHHRTELFDPVSLQPVPDRLGANRALDWVFELHHYLLAGETGRIISGLFGLAIAGLVAIGLYLWWPWRRGWRLSLARPARPTRAGRLWAHTVVSILAAPALLLTALTGSAIVFHETTRGALGHLFGTADPSVATTAETGTLAALAGRQLPDATPRLLLPPAKENGRTTLRLREAQEIHPNGRSTLTYDLPSGAVVAATSDKRSGAGEKVYNSLYPLHTGHAGGMAMRLLLLAGALLAMLGSVYGAGAWLAGRKHRRRLNSSR